MGSWFLISIRFRLQLYLTLPDGYCNQIIFEERENPLRIKSLENVKIFNYIFLIRIEYTKFLDTSMRFSGTIVFCLSADVVVVTD